MGRRIKKTVDGVATWFVWDGTSLLGEYDASGNRTRRYAYLPNGYAPAQMEDATGTYNVHSDHLDTPKLLTDATQQVVWRGRQEAFGQTIVDPASTVTMNVRFPGQYYDSETGLHYNYSRDYNPVTGRYIEADPLGLRSDLNVYGYARQNPVRWIDPRGQQVLTDEQGFPLPQELYDDPDPINIPLELPPANSPGYVVSAECPSAPAGCNYNNNYRHKFYYENPFNTDATSCVLLCEYICWFGLCPDNPPTKIIIRGECAIGFPI